MAVFHYQRTFLQVSYYVYLIEAYSQEIPFDSERFELHHTTFETYWPVILLLH